MDKKNKKNLLQTLRDYFSGKNSEKGEQIYDKWFSSFDDSEGYLDQLDEEDREIYKFKSLLSLKEKLKETTSPASLKDQRNVKRTVLYKIAAILLIGGMLSIAGVYMSSITNTDDVSVVMVEQANSVGQVTEFTLPDGSSVWLSAVSSLEYPEEFSKDNRTVNLQGEAFFDVKYDSERPFQVVSGPVTTMVLGTSFNVKAYQSDPVLEVTLASGKVEVFENDGNQRKTLEPNQQVSFEREIGFGDIRNRDAALSKAWTRGELVFMRESFADITRTLERWFGVEFIFENEDLKNQEFVYHFKELSLENSMIVLNEIADFDYSIENGRVYVRQSTK